MRTHKQGQSALLLLDVIEVLNELKIDYAVIGAMAASFYGVVRASLDADAVMSFQESREASQLLVEKLKKKGFKVAERHGDRSDPLRGLLMVEDSYQNRVDLLKGIRGMDEDFFLRIVKVPFSDSKIQIVAVEDFIAMKIFAGGPQDIEDVKNVLKVSAQRINLKLLKKLSLQYGKKVLKALEDLLKQ